MPTVSISFIDVGNSSSTIRTIRPTVFLTLESDGTAVDWVASARNANRKLPRFVDEGVSVDAIIAGVSVRPTILDIPALGPEDRVFVTIPPRPVIFIETLIDEEDSFDIAIASVSVALFILDIGESFDSGEYSFQLPPIAEPGPNQIRGSINLIRNPSLEKEDIGLTDWSASTQVTLTRSDEDSWVGFYSAYMEVESGAVDLPYIEVITPSNLQITGTTSWIASIEAKGDALDVRIGGIVYYTDATSEEFIFDPDAEDVPEYTPAPEFWNRLSSSSITPNPNKVVDYFVLRFYVHSEADTVFVYLDGAMFEPEYSGGMTSYVDGDQGEGYYWTSTPHLSPSVRETQ